METLKQLNRMWVCVGQTKDPDYSSIAYKRTDSIKNSIKGTYWSWRKWKSKGWKCIRVNIHFEEIEKP